MASVLTRMLGFERLDLAEDIVQETMIQALRSWPFQGIPDNPSAWLYRVAKNKALDIIRREQLFRQISPQLAYEYEQDNAEMMINHYFFDEEITDSQLRMLFACCHPLLSMEAQVTMCLKILCGLSVKEIANAFLVSPDTIEKRLYRAKEKLRAEAIRLDVPTGPQLASRLDAVLKTIYLLFNEGYNSSHPDTIIRQDLCEEGMRLCHLLTQHPKTQFPPAYALLALMCFQAARFDARTSNTGDIILLPDQNRSLWNADLIAKGKQFLNRAATGDILSEYHIEAAIAAYHCLAPSYTATDWGSILAYYNLLLAQKPSPIVALHRAVALAEVEGEAAALEALSQLTTLSNNHYFQAIYGHLYERLGLFDLARQHYQKAATLTSSQAEKRLMEEKIKHLH